jgi:hypothetical protein
MRDPQECQQLLGHALKVHWQGQGIDDEALIKHLLLSRKQLVGLREGDPAPFHTYGIYLRALAKAMQMTALDDRPELQQCLHQLEKAYAASPRGTQILKVRQTVNRHLGEAPFEADAPKAGHPQKALLWLVPVAVVLVVLVLVNR